MLSLPVCLAYDVDIPRHLELTPYEVESWIYKNTKWELGAYACKERCSTAERYLNYRGYSTEKRIEFFPKAPYNSRLWGKSHCYLRWIKGNKYGKTLWINDYGKDLRDELIKLTRKVAKRRK